MIFAISTLISLSLNALKIFSIVVGILTLAAALIYAFVWIILELSLGKRK